MKVKIRSNKELYKRLLDAMDFYKAHLLIFIGITY